MKTLLFITTLALGITTLSAQDNGGTKLLEPFAPKPSGTAPAGWEIKLLDGSLIESKTMLKTGREIKVSAPAYELVPKAGGVVITDPGFDPKLATAQKNTIGAVLTQYSEKAGELQKTLQATIADLEKSLGTEKPSTEKKVEEKPTEAKPSPTPSPEPKKKK